MFLSFFLPPSQPLFTWNKPTTKSYAMKGINAFLFLG